MDLAQGAEQVEGSGLAQALDTQAAAYAEAGRFDEAVAAARRALAACAGQENPALADRIRARLALYESHSPYHEPNQGKTAR